MFSTTNPIAGQFDDGKYVGSDTAPNNQETAAAYKFKEATLDEFNTVIASEVQRIALELERKAESLDGADREELNKLNRSITSKFAFLKRLAIQDEENFFSMGKPDKALADEIRTQGENVLNELKALLSQAIGEGMPGTFEVKSESRVENKQEKSKDESTSLLLSAINALNKEIQNLSKRVDKQEKTRNATPAVEVDYLANQLKDSNQEFNDVQEKKLTERNEYLINQGRVLIRSLVLRIQELTPIQRQDLVKAMDVFDMKNTSKYEESEQRLRKIWVELVDSERHEDRDKMSKDNSDLNDDKLDDLQGNQVVDQTNNVDAMEELSEADLERNQRAWKAFDWTLRSYKNIDFSKYLNQNPEVGKEYMELLDSKKTKDPSAYTADLSAFLDKFAKLNADVDTMKESERRKNINLGYAEGTPEAPTRPEDVKPKTGLFGRKL